MAFVYWLILMLTRIALYFSLSPVIELYHYQMLSFYNEVNPFIIWIRVFYWEL